MQNLTFSSLSFSVSLAHCRHCQMGKAVGGRRDVHVGDKNAPESFFVQLSGAYQDKRGYPLNIFVRTEDRWRNVN